MSTQVTRSSTREILCLAAIFVYLTEYSYQFFLKNLLAEDSIRTRTSTRSSILAEYIQNTNALACIKIK